MLVDGTAVPHEAELILRSHYTQWADQVGVLVNRVVLLPLDAFQHPHVREFFQRAS